ncbi:MAG: 30S ribosome-binding factor RbfA [Kiritimatiellae bacterium]|nr:30S ribosome-binding factor RbfA [Kiritimatiellia bacterium]
MPSQRLIRVNELIKREIAQSLYRIMHQSEFDFSAITITQVMTNSDLRPARVLVSVRGDQASKKRMVGLLNRSKRDFQNHLKKNIVLKYIPHLSFELDESIAAGDHVLDIILRLENEETGFSAPGKEL